MAKILAKSKKEKEHLYLKSIDKEIVTQFKKEARLLGYHFNEFFEKIVGAQLGISNGSKKSRPSRSIKKASSRKKASA
jgi:hypothetical protein